MVLWRKKAPKPKEEEVPAAPIVAAQTPTVAPADEERGALGVKLHVMRLPRRRERPSSLHLKLDRHAHTLIDTASTYGDGRGGLQAFLPYLLGVAVLHQLYHEQYRVHLVDHAAGEQYVSAAQPRRAHVRVSPL